MWALCAFEAEKKKKTHTHDILYSLVSIHLEFLLNKVQIQIKTEYINFLETKWIYDGEVYCNKKSLNLFRNCQTTVTSDS